MSSTQSSNVHTTSRADLSTMLLACSAALASLVPIALYQTGVIPHLPDPPSDLFASDQITGSSTARPFGIPDSYLGLLSYSTTFALIILAGRSRLARRLLAAKLVIDGGMASTNAVKQIVQFKKICSWCMLTAAATAVLVPAGRGLLESSATALTKELGEGPLGAAYDHLQRLAVDPRSPLPEPNSNRRVRQAFSASH